MTTIHLEEDDHPGISCKDAELSDGAILVVRLITHNRKHAIDTIETKPSISYHTGKISMSGLHAKDALPSDGSTSVACLITHHLSRSYLIGGPCADVSIWFFSGETLANIYLSQMEHRQ